MLFYFLANVYAYLNIHKYSYSYLNFYEYSKLRNNNDSDILFYMNIWLNILAYILNFCLCAS